MNLNETFEQYRNEPCDLYLTQVIKNSQNLIYSIVVKIVKHNQDAEDLTQEILIKIIQNINLLPKNTNFIGWVSKTSLNAAINLYHHKKRVIAIKSDYQTEQLEKSSTKEDETISVIYQHLSKLEEIEQSLLINKHVHQMTFDQLSNLYKLPVSTIRTKIENGIKKLRFSIEKAGFAGVALTVFSVLDNLKATEVSIELVPKVKPYFPNTYSKPSTSIPIAWVITTSVIAIISIYFGIIFLNHQYVSTENNELIKNKKNKNLNIDSINNANTKKHISNLEDTIAKAEPVKSPQKTENIVTPLSQTTEAQNSDLVVNFAGQLLDSLTKKPIADAKLEIWDIYTFERLETKTDEEGKYTLPDNLDTSFFYYLKFYKEDYVVKQTFQHFAIHKNITVLMNKGEKITCKINFETSINATIYLGSHFTLNAELHLTENQKNVLIKVFRSILENAPIEVYTNKKLILQNANEILIKDMPIEQKPNDFFCSNSDFLFYNFGLIYNENKFIKSIGIQNGYGSQTNNRDKNQKYILTLFKNNLPLQIQELQVEDKRFNKIVTITNNNEYPGNFTYEGDLMYRFVSINENENYFCQYGDAVTTLETGIFHSIQLIPCTKIKFEPLTLGSNYNNAQMILGNSIYSKKSKIKKSKSNDDVLKIYDAFFEELFVNETTDTPIGGVIDINSYLNASDYKNFKISISLINKILINTEIKVYFSEKEFDEKRFQNVKIDSTGFGLIKIPSQIKWLKIQFESNNTYYTHKVDLNLINSDFIQLNFDKKIELKINPEVMTSYIMANKLEIAKYDACINTMMQEGGIHLSNDNTLITLPLNKVEVCIEDKEEYILSDLGYSIKTDYNELKALKTLVLNSTTQTANIELSSNFDYATVKLNIIGQKADEEKKIEWFILEDCEAHKLKKKFQMAPYEYLKQENEVFDKEESTSTIMNKGTIQKSKGLPRSITIGEENINAKTVQLLNYRNYFLIVRLEGYITYEESFRISESGNISKTINLNKPNAITFLGTKKKEFDEITKILQAEDIIFEYNKKRILNTRDFISEQKKCTLDSVLIKIIRNNKVFELQIPPLVIFEIKDIFYDDTIGLLNKALPPN